MTLTSTTAPIVSDDDDLDVPEGPAKAACQPVLDGLCDDVPGIRGGLIATLDGRPVAARLPERDARSTAAMVAASLGLGSRLADFVGDGSLREMVVRSTSGYVIVYAVGHHGVLAILAGENTNLARVHLAARAACEPLDDALASHGPG